MPITTNAVNLNPAETGKLDTTLCDNVCQWLAAGQWFSPGTPVSSTNTTDCHDIKRNIVESGIKHPNPSSSWQILLNF